MLLDINNNAEHLDETHNVDLTKIVRKINDQDDYIDKLTQKIISAYKHDPEMVQHKKYWIQDYLKI